MQEPLQPPVPYDDFTFGFDPALHNIYPSPPPLPSSADLFSPSETTDLYGFLDNFNFDLDAEVQGGVRSSHDMSTQNGDSSSYPSSVTLQSVLTRSMSMPQNHKPSLEAPTNQPRSGMSPAISERRGSTSSTSSGQADGSASRNKPLLSTPQKRLNHIMSEQKRRNAIRDGYVQLTTLLAPAGAPPGAGMPTRGRPKGSGARGNGRGRGSGGFKGKSGILFRAVEYIHWLEEGKDALQEEVDKLEAAAGIHHS